MAKRKQTRNPARSVAIIGLLALLGAGAIAAYVRLAPADHVPNRDSSPERRQPATQHSDEVKQPAAFQLRAFRPEASPAGVVWREENLPNPSNASPQLLALNKTLSYLPFLPNGAHALSVDVQGDQAEVNFTRESKHTYGTEDEKTLLDAIRLSLGQFPEISRIKVLVDGEVFESFGGVDLTEPLEVLRPSQLGGGTLSGEEVGKSPDEPSEGTTDKRSVYGPE